MEWIMIFEMILEMLARCQENRDKAEIRAGLRDPGAREYRALRKIIRNEDGLRGHALRNKAREGLVNLKEMDDEEIDAMMSDSNKIYLKNNPSNTE